jgi:hypothetical protein
MHTDELMVFGYVAAVTTSSILFVDRLVREVVAKKVAERFGDSHENTSAKHAAPNPTNASTRPSLGKRSRAALEAFIKPPSP